MSRNGEKGKAVEGGKRHSSSQGRSSIEGDERKAKGMRRSKSMDFSALEKAAQEAPRLSLLASERIVQKKEVEIVGENDGHKGEDGHDKHSNRGLVNLCILLLVLTNFRECVTNLIQYGPLFVNHLVESSHAKLDLENWSGLVTFLSLNVYVLAAWMIERAASLPRNSKTGMKSGRLLSRSLSHSLRVANLLCTLVGPTLCLMVLPSISLGSRIIVSLWSCVVFLKLTSYTVENAKCCEGYWGEVEVKGGSHYPQNLTVPDMYLFLLMPTLCYSTWFPRTQSIRWLWAARRVGEIVMLSFIIWGIAVQYILPIVQKTPKAFAAFDIPFLFERLLKLSVPNLYVWLAGFYVLFHVYLNLLAELTWTADRMFYGDWWNATTLEYFWRNWNLPVHTWLVAYVYKPALHSGCSRTVAYLLVFFVSAVFHELIVAVSFGTVRLWAFWAMFLQVPLISLTRPMKGNASGNIIFWLSMGLGQAFCVIMYYNYAME